MCFITYLPEAGVFRAMHLQKRASITITCSNG